MAKVRNPSRPQRWQEACEKARKGLEEAKEAFQALEDLRAEYEEWQGGLPENLQQGALADKLQAVVDLELDPETAFSEVEDALRTAEDAELPKGFGRD